MSRYVTLCHVMSCQDLLVLTSPRPRGPDTELSDLLDHCVTLGEETGDILDQFEQRVVLVSAHWSRHRHVTSCRPLIGPLCRWCRATCLRATAPLWRRSTPRCSRRPSTAWTRTEVRRGRGRRPLHHAPCAGAGLGLPRRCAAFDEHLEHWVGHL